MSDLKGVLNRPVYPNPPATRNNRAVMTFRRLQVRSQGHAEKGLTDKRHARGSKRLPPLSNTEQKQQSSESLISRFKRLDASAEASSSKKITDGFKSRKSSDLSLNGKFTLPKKPSQKTFTGLPLDKKSSQAQLKKRKSKGHCKSDKSTSGSTSISLRSRSRSSERKLSKKSEWANIVQKLQIHKNGVLRKAIRGFKAGQRSDKHSQNAKSTGKPADDPKPKKLTKRKTTTTGALSGKPTVSTSADVSIQGKTISIKDRISQLRDLIATTDKVTDKDTNFVTKTSPEAIPKCQQKVGREPTHVNQVNIGDSITISGKACSSKTNRPIDENPDASGRKTKFKGAGNSIPAMTTQPVTSTSAANTLAEERKRITSFNDQVLAVENTRINTILNREKVLSHSPQPAMSPQLQLESGGAMPTPPSQSLLSGSLSKGLLTVPTAAIPTSAPSSLMPNLYTMQFNGSELRHGSPVPVFRDRSRSMSPIKDIMIPVPRLHHLAPLAKDHTGLQEANSVKEVSVLVQEASDLSNQATTAEADDFKFVVTNSEGEMVEPQKHLDSLSPIDGRESGYLSLSQSSKVSPGTHNASSLSLSNSRLSVNTSTSSPFLDIPAVSFDSRARSPFSRTTSVSLQDVPGQSPDFNVHTYGPLSRSGLEVPKDPRAMSSLSVSLPALDLTKRPLQNLGSSTRSLLGHSTPSTSLSIFPNTDNLSPSNSLPHLIPQVRSDSRANSRMSLGSPVGGNMLSVPQYLEPISGYSSTMSIHVEEPFSSDSRANSRNSLASQIDPLLSVSQNLDSFSPLSGHPRSANNRSTASTQRTSPIQRTSPTQRSPPGQQTPSKSSLTPTRAVSRHSLDNYLSPGGLNSMPAMPALNLNQPDLLRLPPIEPEDKQNGRKSNVK